MCLDWKFDITQLILILTIIVFYVLIKPKRNYPPGPWGLPIFGANLFTQEPQYKLFGKWSKKYGAIVKARVGISDIIILSDSQVMREALNDQVFSGRGENKVLNIIAGGKYGITSNEGADWAEQRRFVLKHLREFGFGKQSMEGITMREVIDFLNWVKSQNTEATLVNQRLTLATLNTLWSLVAGQRKPQDDTTLSFKIDQANDGLQALARASYLVLFPNLIELLPNYFLKPWLQAKRGMESLRAEFSQAIQDHKDHPAELGRPRDLIDVYLDAIQKATEEEPSFYKEHGEKSLLAVVGDMFAAGAGASSEAINWAILFLCKNLTVQEKFQDEIDHVVGRYRSPKLSDRTEMPYSEALINEVLRFASVVPTIFHYTTANTSLRGYEIAKGSTIISNVYEIHHSPDNWNEPEIFKPERFLTADGKSLEMSMRTHLIPFGIGKRQCIGETLARSNLFLFLASIFQQFTVHLAEGYENVTVEPKPGFILEPTEYKVIFCRRK